MASADGRDPRRIRQYVPFGVGDTSRLANVQVASVLERPRQVFLHSPPTAMRPTANELEDL